MGSQNIVITPPVIDFKSGSELLFLGITHASQMVSEVVFPWICSLDAGWHSYARNYRIYLSTMMEIYGKENIACLSQLHNIFQCDWYDLLAAGNNIHAIIWGYSLN